MSLAMSFGKSLAKRPDPGRPRGGVVRRLLLAAALLATADAARAQPGAPPLPRDKPALGAALAVLEDGTRRVTSERILPAAPSPVPAETDASALAGPAPLPRPAPDARGAAHVAAAPPSASPAAPLLAPPALGPTPAFSASAEPGGAPMALAPRPAVGDGVPERAPPSAAANVLFGGVVGPAPLAARAIGSYARGCLAGATALPVNGATWQVMRLSRNRNWGHPRLIEMLQRLAADAPSLGWPGLLVGDLAQPRGGPMLSGHSSHQIGLDADIWLTPMPQRTLSREERETMTAVSMLKGLSNRPGADRGVDPAKWTAAHARLIRRAAQEPEVARIFVHPGIKQALCRFETGPDRAWLSKVRPWWGHHYHFHVRIACPEGSVGCKDQDPVPPGDGCGQDLDWWLSDEPWVPKRPKRSDPAPAPAKKKPLPISALPAACSEVLVAR